MKRKLTPKQQKFADAYIECGNATKAAIDADYSKKTARVIGQENLLKPAIKDYIDARLKELASERVASQQEVLEFLTRVMRRQELEQVVVTLRKARTIPMTNSNGDTYDKLVYEDVDDVVDTKTKNSDSMKAADILTRVLGISKGLNPELESAKTRKIKAEAEMAEGIVKDRKRLLAAQVDKATAEATKAKKDVDGSNVPLPIFVDDVPEDDEEIGGDADGNDS
ncbi:terminase small subunit [Levilactobacillus brevis]|uniref:terminase small subunit n=1 Tax=Levilactobacillus brevis TaxID=1580 RepID=UPI00112320CA|nr:terminase small subunit [Levilactobacillus brevis]TOY85736.1 terminase small subunit [Levilactobacillus brevis]